MDHLAGDKEASSDARKTQAGPNSEGWPARFMAVSLPDSFIFLLSNDETMSGAHTGPGATPFTLIFFWLRLLPMSG
nr:hypothetical protein [Niabella ginsenosidivorans]